MLAWLHFLLELRRIFPFIAFHFSDLKVFHTSECTFSHFSSVTQSCLTLCDPMDCITQDLPVHPTILSSIDPFSSCLQSFPSSVSFQMGQFFASGGQNLGVSASTSVLPMNIQDWSPLGRTGWISLQSSLLQECTFSTFKTRNIGLSTFPASMSLFLSLPTRCSIYNNSYVFTLPRKSRVIITPQS